MNIEIFINFRLLAYNSRLFTMIMTKHCGLGVSAPTLYSGDLEFSSQLEGWLSYCSRSIL
jgi:hypothetical protein